MNGAYASLSVLENGDLSIKITELGRGELEEFLTKTKDEREIMPDLLEDIFVNSDWGMVQPEDICALTSAPLISSGLDYDFHGLVSVDKIWWFPNYQITNAMEELLEKGEVVFSLAEPAPAKVINISLKKN